MKRIFGLLLAIACLCGAEVANGQKSEENKEFSLVDYLDARFDAVDARFDSVNTRFDAVEKRLAGMDKRLDGMDARLCAVEISLNGNGNVGIKQQIERVETKIDIAGWIVGVVFVAVLIPLVYSWIKKRMENR